MRQRPRPGIAELVIWHVAVSSPWIAIAFCGWTWPEFRVGLGATLFFCGMISAVCGAFTMSARNGAAAAGLLGGIAATLIGWALLTMVSSASVETQWSGQTECPPGTERRTDYMKGWITCHQGEAALFVGPYQESR
jgi:hypothetical protein